MSTTPTFVSVINEIRDMKFAFDTMASAMNAARAVGRTEVERMLSKGMADVGETMSKRLQSLSVNVSMLAINYSKEDLDDIMKAISK